MNIKSFIKDCLEGDIDKLKDFSLEILRDDKDYGCPNLIFDEIGTGKDYRGDTMNPIGTILSASLRDDLWDDKVKKPLDPLRVRNNKGGFELTDRELIKTVPDFLEKCCSIGNMMVLPNIKGKKIDKTLNQFRGTEQGFRDYIPCFLQEIDKCFADNPDCNENFKDIFDQNDFYFGKDEGKLSFDEFCEKNYSADNYRNKDTFKFLFDENGEKDEKYICWQGWKWDEGDNMKTILKR